MVTRNLFLIFFVSLFSFLNYPLAEVLESTETEEPAPKVKEEKKVNSKESAKKKAAEQEEEEEEEPAPLTSRDFRKAQPISVGVMWNPISFWLPNKTGFNASFNFSEKNTIALEYQSYSIKAAILNFNLAEIKESKYGVMYKSFGYSNMFFVSYGIMRYQFRSQLGSSLFNAASIPIAPLFDISSVGFQFGLGTQTNWSNGVTLGLDWFNIYFHSFAKSKNTEIFNYLNATDKDSAQKVVDLIYNVSIIELFKIQLNYSF